MYGRKYHPRRYLKSILVVILSISMSLTSYPVSLTKSETGKGYLKISYINLRGDRSEDVQAKELEVKTKPEQSIIEAYTFQKPNEYQYFVAEVDRIPDLNEEDTVSIYGIKDEKMDKEPIAVNVKKGQKFYLGFFEYDGIALVQETSDIRVKKQKLNIEKPEDGVLFDFDGYLPENTNIEIEPVKGEKDEIHHYDITIYDDEGKVFQPIVGRPIKITIRSEKIEQANEDNKELVAYHQAENQEQEEIEIVSAKKDYVIFEASHFSEYLIREHEGDDELITPRRTYHFLSYQYQETQTSGVYEAGSFNFYTTAGDLIDYQIIKDGDSLQMVPNPPNKTEEYFYGWYVVQYHGEENGLVQYSWPHNSERIRFNREIDVPETEDTDVYLAPVYSDYRFVTFHENEFGQPNANNVLTRKLVKLGDDNTQDVLISDVRAKTPDSQRIVFWGWSYGDSQKQTVDSLGNEMTQYFEVTGTDEEIDLYPVFKQARWLTFVAGESGSGAEYVPAMFIVQGDSVSSLPISSRNGYIFKGWYPGSQDDNGHIYYDLNHQVADENGNIVNGSFDLGQGNSVQNGQITLNENQTLYARWEEKETSKYTVIIWKQKVTDDKNATTAEKTYDYESSEVRTAPTGTIITSSNADRNKNFTGFTYSRTVFEGSTEASGVLEATDSSIINVYYDRNIMSINYYFPTSMTYPSDAQTAYSYTVTTSDNGTQYGIVNGDYVQLTYTTENYYSFTTNYNYTQTNSTSGTLYGIYNGEYVRVYYNAGNFYRTRTRQGMNYVYSNQYTGTVFTRGYGVEYIGTRYTRFQSGGQYVYTPTTATTGTLYGLDDNGVYQQLTGSQSTIRHWMYNGEEYTGTRYTRSNMTNYRMYHWTGLYDSDFASNGYSWESISGYRWNEQQNGGGTTQTLLDSFNNRNIVYNLYSQGENGNNYIYHYKQNLDGTYSLDSRVYARTNNASGTFNFSNKFQGFTVSTYSTSTEGFSPTGGSHSAASGTSANLTYPIHIYHTRNRYSLTYAVDFYDEGTQDRLNQIYKTVEGIQYGAPLTNYAAYTVGDLEHSEFTGWYSDATGIVPYDFGGTMPASNEIVYAGFQPVYYPISIDPNGAEIDHRETQYSTYTWLRYGQTIKEYRNLTREYVQDDEGEYVYLYITFNGENNGYGINSDYRNAVYIKADEVDEYYDENYANSGLTRDEFMNCISGQRYRPAKNTEVNTLMGWYRVRNDGTLSSTPYNFNDAVTGPVNLRAVWRLSGVYYISYNPIMTSLGIGGSINSYLDPDINDAVHGGKYIDQSQTFIKQQPSNIPEGYVFEGWRIVDGQGNPLQDDVLYNPGDDFTINAQYADNLGCIHLEAYYELDENEIHKVDVASLTLDANGGYVKTTGLTPGDTHIYADEEEEQLHFDNQINNTNIHLINYIRNFKHTDKFTLIGWDKSADPDDYIPEIPADAELGIDRNTENLLYALWEPMVYITFENHTDEPLTFDLEFTDYDGDVLKQYDGHINEVTEQYKREKFYDTIVTLQPNEVLKLVLPEGEHAKYRVSGSYLGSKDRLYVYNSGGETSITPKNQSYIANGELFIDPVGRVITFVDEMIQIPPPSGYDTDNVAFRLMFGSVLLFLFIMWMIRDRRNRRISFKRLNAIIKRKNDKRGVSILLRKEIRR